MHNWCILERVEPPAHATATGTSRAHPLLPPRCRIVFLGPPASAMKALGDKISSTVVAQSVGVPCIKWSGSHVTLPKGSADVDAETYAQCCVNNAAHCKEVAEQVCRAPAPAPATWTLSVRGPGLPCGVGGGGRVKRPRQQPTHPQYANYWAPLTRKRHIPPHSAQPRHTNYWAPRTRKRHQQEHRPQRPTESSDPTQHAKGRTGDRPGPRKGATTRRNVTQGGGGVHTWWMARTTRGGAGAPGPHAHKNAVRQGGRPEWTAKTVKRPRQQPAQPQHANHWGPLTRKRSPGTPTTGLRERGNDTGRSTGRSGRQKAATRRNMRREERVTVQGPIKKQQPDGMSHGGVHTSHHSFSRLLTVVKVTNYWPVARQILVRPPENWWYDTGSL